MAELVDAADSKSVSSNRVLVRVQSSAIIRMDWVSHFDLFLFDFDGLLVDTEKQHFEAYQELCRRRGYQLPWDINQFFAIAHLDATGIRKALEALFPILFEQEPHWEVLYAEKKRIYEESLQKSTPSLMPGVQALLEKLAQLGRKRCVVTNSPLRQIELIRDRIPILQTIPKWYTRETYQKPKPAPDGYLLAMAELKAERDRVIGFEDSIRGYQSLKNAGVPTAVLICPQSHPLLTVERPESLLYASSFDDLSQLFSDSTQK